MSGHRRGIDGTECEACVTYAAANMVDEELRDNVKNLATSHSDYEGRAVVTREMSRTILALRAVVAERDALKAKLAIAVPALEEIDKYNAVFTWASDALAAIAAVQVKT